MSRVEYFHNWIKDFRNIDELCKECSGAGITVYGSTSTYNGGIGGQAMTAGVCDKCWGSGDKHRPWPSHKRFYEMKHRLESLDK